MGDELDGIVVWKCGKFQKACILSNSSACRERSSCFLYDSFLIDFVVRLRQRLDSDKALSVKQFGPHHPKRAHATSAYLFRKYFVLPASGHVCPYACSRHPLIVVHISLAGVGNHAFDSITSFEMSYANPQSSLSSLPIYYCDSNKATAQESLHHSPQPWLTKSLAPWRDRASQAHTARPH